MPETKDLIRIAREVVRDLSRDAPEKAHPGLLLDRLIDFPAEQKFNKEVTGGIVRSRDVSLTELAAKEILPRRRRALDSVGASSFRMTLAAPMSLHLARAGILENAGICLHRTYGFAYLPGTGLKGMARAYAETVWLPAEPEKREERLQQIDLIFGWADTKDRREAVKAGRVLPAHQEIRDSSGAIVFHDAWPTAWPQLVEDVLTCHHPEYYGDSKGEKAPGDWENPVPVNFLAVKPGSEFEFALSLGIGDDKQLLEVARDLLQGALVHLGAGAKTNAGYGYFKEAGGQTIASPQHSLEVHLKLVTDAFLGGSSTTEAALWLRTASIRGLMRSWWRAANSQLPLSELHSREDQLFGSSSVGGCIALRGAAPSPTLRSVDRGTRAGGAGEPLPYLGFGPIMYERAHSASRYQRAAVRAGQSLSLQVTGKSSGELNDAITSLWMLTAFGGVGARSRRGWGGVSLHASPRLGEFLEQLGLPFLPGASSAEEYASQLKSGLESVLPSSSRPTCHTLDWLGLTREATVLVSKSEFPSALDAMTDLGRKFMEFRNRLGQNRNSGEPGPDYHLTKRALETRNAPESLPHRAGFGLPYLQQYRSLDRRTAAYTPRVPKQSAGRRTEFTDLRRASQLLLKVVELSIGRHVWQAAFFPSRFLPEGAVIHALEGKSPLGGSDAVLDHFGPIPPVIVDFLNELKSVSIELNEAPAAAELLVPPDVQPRASVPAPRTPISVALRLLFPPNKFDIGQQFASDESKVAELIKALESKKSHPEYKQTVEEYAKELRVGDKQRAKKVRDKPLGMLFDYLREKTRS